MTTTSPTDDDPAPRATTAAQEAELVLRRAKALERMPYFAPILFSLRVLDAPGLGTFAVDARHRLYIDFDAVTAWSALENAEALLHECGHLFRDHAARAEARNVQDSERTAWNIAADAMLNLDLVQAGYRTLGQKGILPAKLGLPDGRTTEWYFDQLRPKLSSDGASESAGKPYAGCGSGAGAAPAPGEIDGAGHGAAQGAIDVERELVRINTAAAIRQHAEQCGRGSVPGGLLQEAEQVLSPPKVPWQQVLAPAIRRAVASRAGQHDVDPSRRHRRRHRVDIAPGRRVLYPGTYRLVCPTSGAAAPTVGDRTTGVPGAAGPRTPAVPPSSDRSGHRPAPLLVLTTTTAVPSPPQQDSPSELDLTVVVGRVRALSGN